MHILIYGGKGWIGQQFINYLEILNLKSKIGVIHTYELGNVRINPQNEKEIYSEIINSKCTHVISLLGRTFGEGYSTIDYLEQKGKLRENLNDNLYAPLILSIICHTYNIHFTYLGTGCIYNGKDIKENDSPNFFGSSYSTTKGFTDRLINNFNALNLRIRMPISSIPSSRNFITKITTYKKICSIQNSMTVLDDFIPIFVDMMDKGLKGRYNCTNPNPIDHNTILALYKEIVNPDFTWENFTLEEQSQILLSERSNNTMDTTKISSLYNVPSTTDSIKKILQIYRTYFYKFSI